MLSILKNLRRNLGILDLCTFLFFLPIAGFGKSGGPWIDIARSLDSCSEQGVGFNSLLLPPIIFLKSTQALKSHFKMTGPVLSAGKRSEQVCSMYC